MTTKSTNPRWTPRGKPAASGQTTSSSYASSQEWWRLRAAILKALQPYPEARESVLAAVRSLIP